jgi:hypothetical protein
MHGDEMRLHVVAIQISSNIEHVSAHTSLLEFLISLLVVTIVTVVHIGLYSSIVLSMCIHMHEHIPFSLHFLIHHAQITIQLPFTIQESFLFAHMLLINLKKTCEKLTEKYPFFFQ